MEWLFFTYLRLNYSVCIRKSWYNKLTVNITGVKELKSNGFALCQTSPNPFNNESSVRYQLLNSANSALFIVTNVVGCVVSEKKIDASKGVHSIKLDGYSASVYYYSLNVGCKITTKKWL